MLPISVCIIAKNEEENIEKCLKPLRAYDWEILVVDTGSTDRTKEIAAAYADKVLDYVWCGDFAAARNYSIAQASNDMILVIDCDEYLTEIDIDAVIDLIKTHPCSIGLLSRQNHYQMNGTDSVYADLVERLFSRSRTAYMPTSSKGCSPAGIIIMKASSTNRYARRHSRERTAALTGSP